MLKDSRISSIWTSLTAGLCGNGRGDVYRVYIIISDVVHVQPRFNFSDELIK